MAECMTNLDGTGLAKVLVEKFPTWVSYFKTNGPFRKYGQFEYHRETIDRRLELGSASAAVTDEQFQRALYKTLRAWGIGSRGSRLKPFDEFAAILSRQTQAIAQFETMILDDRQLDIGATINALWTLMSHLPIVQNAALLVPVTKALHHLPLGERAGTRNHNRICIGTSGPSLWLHPPLSDAANQGGS